MTASNVPKAAHPAWVASLLSLSVLAQAQQSDRANPQESAGGDRVSVFRPDASKLTTNLTARPEPAIVHPLANVIKYARQEQEYLKRTVQDFRCRLVKRERIDGLLQDYHFIDMRVREPVREPGRAPVPFSIYLHFLAPPKVAGRQVLYTEGRNDGKMLVRNGGKHFDYVVVNVDPEGESAKRESLMPITRTGFNDMLADMISVLRRHVEADPGGSDTLVSKTSGVKINRRPSTLIRIVHPEQKPGLECHLVNVYVDDELHVPVRIEYYDWPKLKGQPAPLVAEYTYTQLEMNVGLTDDDFDPAMLRSKR